MIMGHLLLPANSFSVPVLLERFFPYLLLCLFTSISWGSI